MSKEIEITGLSTTEKSIQELNEYLLKKISNVEKENAKLKEENKKLKGFINQCLNLLYKNNCTEEADLLIELLRRMRNEQTI